MGLAWQPNSRYRAFGKPMLVLFPFEPPLYQRHGVPVSYVGHPLADVIPLRVNRAAARERLGITDQGSAPVFALLPGSRQSELAAMATFIETGKLFLNNSPVPFFLCRWYRGKRAHYLNRPCGTTAHRIFHSNYCLVMPMTR